MTFRDSLAWTLVLLVAAATPMAAQTPSQRGWSILEEGVKEKSVERRAAAARSLGIIVDDLKALETGRRLFKDPQPQVRSAAATALGQMGSSAAVPDLKAVLSDKDPSVVLAAAHALHLLQNPAAYEVYYAVLTGQRKGSQSLVAEGMETLKDKKKMAEFGVEEGIGFIPFAGFGYSAFKELRKDDVSPVRAGAAAVLAKDPDPRSADALVKAASDKSWIVRAAALDALAKRGDPKLMEPILPELSDKKEIVRYTAAATVIHLSNLAESSKRGNPARPRLKRR